MPNSHSRRDFLIGAITCSTLTAAVTYFLPGGRVAPPVGLRLLTGADPTGGRKLLFDMWNGANPDAAVEVHIAEGSTDDQKKLMIDAAANGAADLLNLDIINIQEFAGARLISPFQLNRGLFVDRTLQAGQVAGDPRQFWAAPFNTDVGMLFERIRAGGAAPAEHPDLPEVLDQLISAGSQDFVGQVGPGSSASDEAFVVNVLEHAMARDSAILDSAGVPVYDLGRWQRALAPLRNAIVDRRIRPADNEGTSLTAFMTEPRPRFMRNWPVQYRDLQQRDDPDVREGRIRVHPLPGGILGGQSLALVATSRHQARARKLIDFLTGDEAQKVLAAHGLAPTRVAAYTDPNLKAFIPHLETIRGAVENARLRPIHQNYGRFARAVVKHVRPLLADGAELPSMFIDEIRDALPATAS
jgi:multiple sugar transport system substrate-binding protein